MNKNEDPEGCKDRGEYPPELASAEDMLVACRRAACKIPPSQGRVGVALSGGGIRSATFCLGVFQALAKARSGGKPGDLLGRIDYLSTVSGGGYFGSFLGRLFSRSHIKSVEDVSRVLEGTECPPKGQTTFRFLRDNGRYLAPRGSGDLLALIAVTLRNWIAVQTVLMLFVLTAFVSLQYADIRLPGEGIIWPAGSILWNSGLLLLLGVMVVLWALPAAWAYWVIGLPLSKRQLFRRSDVIVLALLGVAFGLQWIPKPSWSGPSSAIAEVSSWPTITLVGVVITVVAAFTFLWSLASNLRAVLNWLGIVLGMVDMETALADASLARSRLTRWLKKSLVAIAVVAVVALVDGLGGTVYALFKAEGGFTNVTAAIATLLTAFGGVATFGRQFLVLLGGEGRKNGPRVPLSVLSWLVAVLILGAWLISLSALSHAIAWAGEKPFFADSLVKVETVRLADAEAVVVAAEADGRRVVRPLEVQTEPAAAAATRDARFTGRMLLLLVALVFAVGSTRSFLNASSLHTFYSQRLTRAYLGASNRERLDNDKAHVTDVIAGDDLPSDLYWNWPRRRVSPGKLTALRDLVVSGARAVRSIFPGVAAEEPKLMQQAARSITCKGGPLHLVNVTINETFDNRTGVQRQDRKGVPLAVGPGGLSVGVRHHLIADAIHGFIARPAGSGHAVFRPELLNDEPEVMTLGRWVSISGAAFSSALGARTTVPLALLATFANVRLGYWWDSGVGKGWTKPWLPVYRGLLSECIARLRGTGIRLWNLSDGGHFENLGGYELIRRRLPLIVLIDAEADPDFEFPGLAELIRKARLDFGAEIRFLDEEEIRESPVLIHRSVFTSLQRLRRGPWNSEEKVGTTFSKPAERRSYSLAHAALAIVSYRDGTSGWLVYLKASLTGKEPIDVLQYHAKRPDFPHETTADQFFDEAQWESYRRLGEHIGDTVLTSTVFALANMAP